MGVGYNHWTKIAAAAANLFQSVFDDRRRTLGPGVTTENASVARTSSPIGFQMSSQPRPSQACRHLRRLSPADSFTFGSFSKMVTASKPFQYIVTLSPLPKTSYAFSCERVMPLFRHRVGGRPEDSVGADPHKETTSKMFMRDFTNWFSSYLMMSHYYNDSNVVNFQRFGRPVAFGSIGCVRREEKKRTVKLTGLRPHNGLQYVLYF